MTGLTSRMGKGSDGQVQKEGPEADHKSPATDLTLSTGLSTAYSSTQLPHNMAKPHSVAFQKAFSRCLRHTLMELGDRIKVHLALIATRGM